MRRYAQEVRCVVDPATGSPQRVLWRRRQYIVRDVLARWRSSAPWWRRSDVARNLDRIDESEVWRVEMTTGAVVDLIVDLRTQIWSMWAVHD